MERLKNCKKCNQSIPLNDFYTQKWKKSKRGTMCSQCAYYNLNAILEHEIKTNWSMAVLIIAGIQESYPGTWLDYIDPGAYYLYRLYSDRECLYCGIRHEVLKDQETEDLYYPTFNVEHMNCLNLGGDNSPRNIAISCEACNSIKARKNFIDWLKKIDPKRQQLVREFYNKKLGYYPEEYIIKEPNHRHRDELSSHDDLIANEEIRFYLNRRLSLAGAELIGRGTEVADRDHELALDARKEELVRELSGKIKPFPWY